MNYAMPSSGVESSTSLVQAPQVTQRILFLCGVVDFVIEISSSFLAIMGHFNSEFHEARER
ncbi:hypothetical protein Sjap_013571 [Stephania japonica]|uniref:Uncharacterized protein n=1 Tax=Stephania japonica TaxID=461633 RepID=A0AAP0NZ79_9MAGN